MVTPQEGKLPVGSLALLNPLYFYWLYTGIFAIPLYNPFDKNLILSGNAHIMAKNILVQVVYYSIM